MRRDITERKNCLRFVIFAAVSIFLLACADEEQVPLGKILPAELLKRIEDGSAPTILDVRSPGEYATVHIPGAINIPHYELNDRLSELIDMRHQEIVVHCQQGPRADIAQNILNDAGFTKIRELEGHMYQWVLERYPVE